MLTKKSILLFLVILGGSVALLALSPSTADAIKRSPCTKPGVKCCKEIQKAIMQRHDPIFSPFSV